VVDGRFVSVDDGAQAAFCAGEFDVSDLDLVFKAEVEGQGLVEIGVEENVKDGLDQVGLALPLSPITALR